mgnify:CR=1 FL=1
MLSLCFPAYAQQANKNLSVKKKPLSTYQQKKALKAVAKTNKKCHNAYDKKTKRNYLICEGGK